MLIKYRHVDEAEKVERDGKSRRRKKYTRTHDCAGCLKKRCAVFSEYIVAESVCVSTHQDNCTIEYFRQLFIGPATHEGRATFLWKWQLGDRIRKVCELIVN